MMTKRLLSLFILITLALVACGGAEEPSASESLTQIRLPMGFIPNVQYAPYYVAVDKGYFSEAGIELAFDYSFETDGVALVGANELQFALVSGEQVLLARENELPVVYVMAWFRDFPVAVVSTADAGIRTPSDLRGRNIGLPGLFGANYIGLRALLRDGGLTEADVSLESIGFNQVESFMSGQQDIVVGYVSNEPVQLRAQGLDVDVLQVADYVQLASNGMITNETTIANNPELVRRMIKAFLRGLSDTIANPDEAYEISKKHVEGLAEMDEAVQKEVLAVSIDFWKADRLGFSSPQAWENMHNVLLEIGLISPSLDVGEAYSNDFID
jgi:NitT/TauT family transport system substrate-binding protein